MIGAARHTLAPTKQQQAGRRGQMCAAPAGQAAPHCCRASDGLDRDFIKCSMVEASLPADAVWCPCGGDPEPNRLPDRALPPLTFMSCSEGLLKPCTPASSESRPEGPPRTPLILPEQAPGRMRSTTLCVAGCFEEVSASCGQYALSCLNCNWGTRGYVIAPAGSITATPARSTAGARGANYRRWSTCRILRRQQQESSSPGARRIRSSGGT